jgi:hypothetical protein
MSLTSISISKPESFFSLPHIYLIAESALHSTFTFFSFLCVCFIITVLVHTHLYYTCYHSITGQWCFASSHALRKFPASWVCSHSKFTRHHNITGQWCFASSHTLKKFPPSWVCSHSKFTRHLRKGRVLLPRQAGKRPRCECDPSWFCSPHNACFVHESCLCEGSSKWPPVKPVRSRWVSESREWLAGLLSRR